MRISHLVMLAALAAPLAASAQPAPPPAPPGTEPAQQLASPYSVDHKLEFGARLGWLTGGEIRPSGTPRADIDGAPMAFFDFHRIVHPYFLVGGYASITRGGYKFESSEDMDSATMQIISVGASVKTRIPLSPKSDIRVGLHIGRNLINVEDASGSGVNMAPTLETFYRVSPTFALSGQISFISQVSGTAQIGDEDVDFKFAPIWFVSVGGEWHR